MAGADGVIRHQDLPEDLLDEMLASSNPPETAWQNLQSVSLSDVPAAGIPVTGKPAAVAPEMKLEDMQIAAMAAALAQHNGNLSSAARALGVSRNTVYRKLEHLQSGRSRRS